MKSVEVVALLWYVEQCSIAEEMQTFVDSAFTAICAR